jgi:hypothetical protein
MVTSCVPPQDNTLPLVVNAANETEVDATPFTTLSLADKLESVQSTGTVAVTSAPYPKYPHAYKEPSVVRAQKAKAVEYNDTTLAGTDD